MYAQLKNSRTPLQSFFGLAEEECGAVASGSSESTSETNLLKSDDSPEVKEPQIPLTAEEYFSTMNLNGRDIGRLPRVTSKVYIDTVTILSPYNVTYLFLGTTFQSESMVKRTISHSTARAGSTHS